MITLYDPELHEKQIRDYLLENTKDSLDLWYRGMFEDSSNSWYWQMKVVYIKDEKVCGFLFTDSDSIDKVLNIDHLIVFEWHRKQGIAKELLEYVINYARRIALTDIFLICFGKNTGSLSFYKKLWFIEHWRKKYWNKRYGEWDENIYLHKDIK